MLTSTITAAGDTVSMLARSSVCQTLTPSSGSRISGASPSASIFRIFQKTTLTWNTLSAPKESIPANWNIGVAYANNRVFNRELILSYQWQQRYGGQTHLGIEYQISTPLALRMGYRDSRLTSGIGIQLRQFRLDYALLFGDLISTHFLSLLWNF